jgi:hypothetical protein
VNSLADKLGLPPQIAQAVVSFVLSKLLANRTQPGIDIYPDSAQSRAAQLQRASMDDVVQKMNSGQRVTKTAIRKTGMAEELSAQTGLDPATAEASLQEVLNALGGQLGAQP